jgi:hypothetical protein
VLAYPYRQADLRRISGCFAIFLLVSHASISLADVALREFAGKCGFPYPKALKNSDGWELLGTFGPLRLVSAHSPSSAGLENSLWLARGVMM